MDLQGTKEARTQDEGADGPLEAYGASTRRSKEYHKNEGRDSHPHDNPTNIQPLRRQQSPFAYAARGPQTASPAASAVARPREPSPPSLEAMTIPNGLGLSSRDQRLLSRARRYPPVTKRTLSELDLPCIMGNINLRMDANFDRDLHFKPDLDGEKGKRKRKEAADYWDAMAVEIMIYSFRASHSDAGEVRWSGGTRRTFEPRLPAMFETLQDVIKSLVPECDLPSIAQNLEVPLLMQQIRKGVLDMVALATWLGALLKTHCAPMRDEWADRMVEQIAKGSRLQDPRQIIFGLQTLFAILEAMKLDVANHQIRAFRCLLIEDTIPFLQEYFKEKLSCGTFQAEPARLWYLAARDQVLREEAEKNSETGRPDFKPLKALFSGIIDHLVRFQPPAAFPETFLFDSERLWQMRSTIQNLINLEIAWYMFESYVHTQKRYLSAPSDTYSTFRSRIWSLMEDVMEGEGQIEGHDPDLRGGTRWLQNVRSIALEISRFACAACGLDTIVADEVITPMEAALEWHLSNESELFCYFQNTIREKVTIATLASARRFLPLSPLGICEAQRPSLASSTGPAFPPSTNSSQPLSPQQCDIERVAMRLAHMGVLHWRVWAPLLYLRDELAHLQLD